MMNEHYEKWEDISGFPNYEIGDDRAIRNKKTGRILKQCDNNSGYPTVNLYNHGKRTTKGVHRIVAENFVDGYEDGYEVNHKDCDKHNNRRDNLEWVTRRQNEQHALEHGLKHGPNCQPVRIVETGEVFESVRECARAIRGNDTNIIRCLHGRQANHLGFTYEYANEEDVNARANDERRSLERRRGITSKRSVRIVETGETFPSINACARAINGDAPTIIGCLNGKHKTHKGYHYEYDE